MTFGEKLYLIFEDLEKSGVDVLFEDLVILKAIDYLVNSMSGDYRRDLKKTIDKVRDEILDKEVSYERD